MSLPVQPPARTYALDNLRTYLTVLVIFHHAALAYGGTGSFGYRSPYHPLGSSIPLTAFNICNQTFFMGLFFLLSGYFSSIAARKRTRFAFLKEKLKRLGVPTLIYSLFGAGIIRATMAWRTKGTNFNAVVGDFWQGVKNTRGPGGPTWYTALLLTFDAMYTVCRPAHFDAPLWGHASEVRQPNRSAPTPRRHISTAHALSALALASITSFLIRTQLPFGYIFVPLNLNLGYAPQYVLCFCTGIFLQRRSIPLHSPCRPCALVLAGAIVASMNILGFFRVREVLDSGGTLEDVFKLAGGGFNILVLLYSLLNEFVGFMLGSLLLKIFHSPILSKRWHGFGIDLASGSYAAFLVHIPLLVETMTYISEEAWKEQSPVLKAAAVGMLGTVKSWILALVLKWAVERCGWGGFL